ncbi:cell wall / vacuolar inhibitor of fructosidase 1-like [Aristolochia californica]|uniref:cell wall / vacuolar inhibitor of fructosidase 1-like n=1 Tax=Aristolochia californica TaxID=171875 RepID=UPI0035DC7306
MADSVFILKWVLLAFLFHPLSSSSAIATMKNVDTIEKACKRTSHVDLCVSSLESDKRSFGEDYHGLARISLEQALAKGNGVSLQVLKLLSETSDDVMATDLTECGRRYSNIVHMVEDSLQAFDSQSYVLAQFQLSSCIFDASMCKQAFEEQPGRRSPLGDANDIMEGLCVISSELIHLLK